MFTTEADRKSIHTPVMLAHQKHPNGNALIESYMDRYYGSPDDLESFLYLSQVLQAEGIAVGAEHFRRSRPRTMGSLYWQLNDCWPVASWSSIDFSGRWKALHYYARRFYAPVIVSNELTERELKVFAVSDRLEARKATVSVRLMSTAGEVLEQRQAALTLPPLASVKALELPLAELQAAAGDRLNRAYVVTTLEADGEASARSIDYLVPTRQFDLPSPRLAVGVAANGTRAEITVTSDNLARSVYLTTDEPGTTFFDNFFDLLPGETRKITAETSLSADALRRKLRHMSVKSALREDGP
jgi:beta-mannosidase